MREGTLPRVNYFRARRALELFREYRREALLFWVLFTVPDQDTVADEVASLADKVNAMSAAELAAARLSTPRRLNEQIPALQAYARELKVSTEVGVRIPAVAGGGQVTIDGLANLTDRDMANWLLPPPARALSIVDMCIGAAELAERDGLKRLLIPIFWLVDVPALMLRWPWLILEKAGLPADIERNSWTYVLKVALLLVQVAVVLFLLAHQISPDLIRALISSK